MSKTVPVFAVLALLAACADRERAEAYCKGILDTSDGCVERQYTLYEEQEKAADQAAEPGEGATPAAEGEAKADSGKASDSLSSELVKEVQKSCEAKGGHMQKGSGGMGAGCVMGAP